jgi:hypothetical protein
LSDRFRVPGTDECPNWTSTGNDRSGEPNRNSWLAVTDRLRCDPGLQISPDLTFTLAPDSLRQWLALYDPLLSLTTGISRDAWAVRAPSCTNTNGTQGCRDETIKNYLV